MIITRMEGTPEEITIMKHPGMSQMKKADKPSFESKY